MGSRCPLSSDTQVPRCPIDVARRVVETLQDAMAWGRLSRVQVKYATVCLDWTTEVSRSDSDDPCSTRCSAWRLKSRGSLRGGQAGMLGKADC